MVPIGPSVAGASSKAIDTFMAYENCPVVPNWPPGSTWLDVEHGRYKTRHMVEVVPTPGPETLSLRTIPQVLESGGVDDTHYEQQQQVQEYHDRKPMAGKPGQLA